MILDILPWNGTVSHTCMYKYIYICMLYYVYIYIYVYVYIIYNTYTPQPNPPEDTTLHFQATTNQASWEYINIYISSACLLFLSHRKIWIVKQKAMESPSCTKKRQPNSIDFLPFPCPPVLLNFRICSGLGKAFSKDLLYMVTKLSSLAVRIFMSCKLARPG